MKLLFLTAATSCVTCAGAAWADTAGCASLAQLKLPDTTLQAAVEQGPRFVPPTPPGASLAAPPPAAGTKAPPPNPLFANLPAFCRVQGAIHPVPDSDIRFEVWLPLADWNGKFQGTGNGGYNGAIVYTALATGLLKHYATANTDMGHQATAPDPGRWALHHPQRVIDEGYRAQHETALAAKAVVQAFYGSRPRHSYFVGCSAGGWEALTEAHRFPQDYDGIIAGAPASQVVHLHAEQIWGYLAARQLPASKLDLITRSVVARCDARDGVQDGLISDPPGCDFQPAQLACRSGQDPAGCLLPAEVAALQKLYDGARFADGTPVYPGWPRGFEPGLFMAGSDGVAALGASTFRDMVYDNPDWDFTAIDYGRDVKAADAKIGEAMNDGSTDLAAFRKAGGKLILWHGWSDPFISALHTIGYYDQLARRFAAPGDDVAAAAAKASDFARLFLAPGVLHCGGGPGPGTFDSVAALESWVERGVAPDSLIASHAGADGKIDRTRPLCVYPRKAVYDGRGDINASASFRCQ